MSLVLTLRPYERVIINGCEVRNSEKSNILTIENRADVVREDELLRRSDANTPVKEAYFLCQYALIYPKAREKLSPIIQRKLAALGVIFLDGFQRNIVEAASFVSVADFYKAMRCIRPVIEREDYLLGLLEDMNAEKEKK